MIIRNIKAEICDVLDISSDSYCASQYRLGLSYLNTVFENDPELLLMLEASRSFWTFWIYKWELRERHFLEHLQGIEEDMPTPTLVEMHKHIHSLEYLMAYPYGKIMELSIHENILK